MYGPQPFGPRQENLVTTLKPLPPQSFDGFFLKTCDYRFDLPPGFHLAHPRPAVRGPKVPLSVQPNCFIDNRERPPPPTRCQTIHLVPRFPQLPEHFLFVCRNFYFWNFQFSCYFALQSFTHPLYSLEDPKFSQWIKSREPPTVRSAFFLHMSGTGQTALPHSLTGNPTSPGHAYVSPTRPKIFPANPFLVNVDLHPQKPFVVVVPTHCPPLPFSPFFRPLRPLPLNLR